MGADKPLCRLRCRDEGAVQNWCWESLDGTVNSGETFRSIFECTQHAKAMGYGVDLATVGIVEDRKAPSGKRTAARTTAPVRATTKRR